MRVYLIVNRERKVGHALAGRKGAYPDSGFSRFSGGNRSLKLKSCEENNPNHG
jgi:hypothetical protein